MIAQFFYSSSAIVTWLFFAAIYCLHVYWVAHYSGICPFWFALYKPQYFLAYMTSVYTIGVCNKMVLT